MIRVIPKIKGEHSFGESAIDRVNTTIVLIPVEDSEFVLTSRACYYVPVIYFGKLATVNKIGHSWLGDILPFDFFTFIIPEVE